VFASGSLCLAEIQAFLLALGASSTAIGVRRTEPAGTRSTTMALLAKFPMFWLSYG
jgi:hypothetical protein